jgi:adenine-specific DNA-methyltransferase
VDVSYLKVFKEASTYTIVWLYKKSITQNNEIRINRCSELDKISETSFQIKQSDIKLSESKIIPINFEYFALAKIERDKDTLGNIAKLKWGTSATGYGQKKIYIDAYNNLAASKQKLYKPILQTSDTKKYYIDWQGEYIPTNIYSDSIIREFDKKKIVIGRVTKQIQACLDEEYCFVGKSTLITDSKINLKFLLSILNSAFANRWYYLKFETTHMAGGYLRFDIPYLEKLPIPKVSKKTETKLIELTNKIITKKTKDTATDTLGLEQQIDNLVYRLYELTYDEVKVIDPEFPLSKKEYERIELE